MKIPPLLLTLLVTAAPLVAASAQKFAVVVTNDLDSARPAETIVIVATSHTPGLRNTRRSAEGDEVVMV